jgi:hypothetical protein
MATTTTTIHPIRLAAAAATVGVLTLAGACGTEAPQDGGQVELVPAPVPVIQQGSPDSIERRLATHVRVPQGSPDSIERRLAAIQAKASCRVSPDTAERLGAKSCVR